MSYYDCLVSPDVATRRWVPHYLAAERICATALGAAHARLGICREDCLGTIQQDHLPVTESASLEMADVFLR